MINVLLLEDDTILNEIITEYLEEKNYEVTSCTDGEAALEKIMATKYDILLLDVNVPSIDGFELLEYLRDIKNTTTAIFITSLSGIGNLRKGFDLGADDYLKKPFELDELHIRIAHHLHTVSGADMLEFGEYKLSSNNQYLIKDDQKIKIKQKEVQILQYFIRSKGDIISLDQLIENVWSSEKIPTYATIRTYIKNLRKALGADAIENIKGSGYRFNII